MISSILLISLLWNHLMVSFLLPTWNPHMQVFIENERVSYRCTGRETLLRRAYDIAEFVNVKRILSHNGYVSNVLYRCIHRFLKKKCSAT